MIKTKMYELLELSKRIIQNGEEYRRNCLEYEALTKEYDSLIIQLSNEFRKKIDKNVTITE